MHATKSSLAAMALSLALASSGCTLHVEHPRIHVTDVAVTGARIDGLVVHVGLAAYNPNAFELPMRDLDAMITIGADRAPAHIDHLDTVLPPQREIPVAVDVLVPWRTIPHALASARSDSALAYHLEGNVTVHHYIDVRAHFARDGSIPREQLESYASRSVLGRLMGARE